MTAVPELVLDVDFRFAIDPTSKGYIELGSGSFGTVFLGEALMRESGRWTSCAIKVLPVTTQLETDAVERELSNLQYLLPHPSIVRLFGVYRNVASKRVGIVTEYLAGGSLWQMLDDSTRNASPPLLRTRLMWLLGLAEALAHMHRQKVIHGDIKPQNVVFSDLATPKFVDFGIAKALSNYDVSFGFVGTLPYAAPEIIPDHGRIAVRTEKADVYAFAMLMFSVFSRREPFHSYMHQFGTSTSKRTPMEILNRVGPLLRGDASTAAGGNTGRGAPLRPSLDDIEVAYTPHRAKELIACCWDSNADARPSMLKVVESLEAMMNSGGGDGDDGAASLVSVTPAATPATWSAVPTVDDAAGRAEVVKGEGEGSTLTGGEIPIVTVEEIRRRRKKYILYLIVALCALIGGSVGIYEILNMWKPKE